MEVRELQFVDTQRADTVLVPLEIQVQQVHTWVVDQEEPSILVQEDIGGLPEDMHHDHHQILPCPRQDHFVASSRIPRSGDLHRSDEPKSISAWKPTAMTSSSHFIPLRFIVPRDSDEITQHFLEMCIRKALFDARVWTLMLTLVKGRTALMMNPSTP